MPIKDHMAYIVLVAHQSGEYLPEQSVSSLDRATVIKDIADGQYEGLTQVIEINPVEGTCRDVTEERRTQALLEARERRLDAIIGSLAEGVVVRDREGRITLANDAAARLAGLALPDLLGQRPESAAWEMLDEHGRQLAPAEYPAMSTMAGGRPIDHQLYGIRALTGRRTAWVSVSTRLLPPGDDLGGDAVVASLSDVTRLRDAEREGRLAAAVFAQVSQPIVVTDGESRVLRINHAFTEAFGYSLEEILGHKVSQLRSARHDAAFYAAMWQQLQKEGFWRGEIWNRRKNGETYPAWENISAVRDADGTVSHYVSMLSDITALKQAEEQLALTVRQMQKAEGVTEDLKAADQLEWVLRMNSIRNRAEEIIKSELIFV